MTKSKNSAFPSSFVWKKEWIRESNYVPPPSGWRPKASQRSGLRFEQNIGKILLLLARKQSFSYHFQRAFTGPEGIKIPDHFWLPAGPEAPFGFVFETKLTWKPSAEKQVSTYAGILSSFFEVPFVSVIIAKNLAPSTPRATLIPSFEALQGLSSEGPWTLHAMWPEHTLKALQDYHMPEVEETSKK